MPYKIGYFSSELLKGHGHNVSAYSCRAVNAWGVVNFVSTVCMYDPGQFCVSVCLSVCLRLFSHYRLRGGL